MAIQIPDASSVTGDELSTEPNRILSVIVPFALEENEGEVLIHQLQEQLPEAEIVLACVEGYPPPVASRLVKKGRVLSVRTSIAGRAHQMNAAAKAASGRWLWFVHADSRLSSGTVWALCDFLAEDIDALGYFNLRYRRDGPALAQLNAGMANLRARWLGMPFGDQGFVLPAAWFERLGGYDEKAPRGEDHLLVWRARQAGLPLRGIRAPLSSSARKYVQLGWCRATVQNVLLTMRQAWPQWQVLRHIHGKRAVKRR